jgi:hypothetical protein
VCDDRLPVKSKLQARPEWFEPLRQRDLRTAPEIALERLGARATPTLEDGRLRRKSIL